MIGEFRCHDRKSKKPHKRRAFVDKRSQTNYFVVLSVVVVVDIIDEAESPIILVESAPIAVESAPIVVVMVESEVDVSSVLGLL